MEPNKEIIRPNLVSYTFNTPEEAALVWAGLTADEQLQMADVYQKAFGGDPWYEVGACQQCGNFTSSMSICQSCSSTSISEAYPTEDLVGSYFPNDMLQAYLPGMFTMAKVEGRVVGFSTGGFVTLGELIDRKYSGNQLILSSIMQETGVSEQDVLFYDNETCVDNSYQGLGIGKLLGEERRMLATELGADLICGRTVNLPWLSLKNRDLNAAGFDFLAFVPDGDNYQINGLLRNFYLAFK